MDNDSSYGVEFDPLIQALVQNDKDHFEQQLHNDIINIISSE
jgi:hypothetical protein